MLNRRSHPGILRILFQNQHFIASSPTKILNQVNRSLFLQEKRTEKGWASTLFSFHQGLQSFCLPQITLQASWSKTHSKRTIIFGVITEMEKETQSNRGRNIKEMETKTRRDQWKSIQIIQWKHRMLEQEEPLLLHLRKMRPQKVNRLGEGLLATKQQNLAPLSYPAAKYYQYYMRKMTTQQYQRTTRMRQITQQSRAKRVQDIKTRWG